MRTSLLNGVLSALVVVTAPVAITACADDDTTAPARLRRDAPEDAIDAPDDELGDRRSTESPPPAPTAPAPESTKPTPAECRLAFDDVRPDHPAHASVRSLFVNGITDGCSEAPLLYCPSDPALRKHAAVMLVRSAGAKPSAALPDAYFDDVAGDPNTAGFINRLSELGVTNGCGTRLFCPNDALRRDQVATFLVRAANQALSTAPADKYFDDIAGNPHAAAINKLKELGVTNGCAERRYCPDQTLSRGNFAIMIARAFKLDDAVCAGVKP